jgi:membrane protein
MKRWPRHVITTVWEAIKGFIEDQALTQSAAVAFFTVLSLAPIMVLLLLLTSNLGPELQRQLVEGLASLIGKQGSEVVETVVDSASSTNVNVASMAGWISVGTLLVSATAVFGQLQVALNTVWAVKTKTHGLGIAAWLRKRLLSLGLIITLGFLLLVSLVVSSTIAAMLHGRNGRVEGEAEVVWTVIDLVIPFAMYCVLFMAVFRYIPDARLRWRHVAFGSVVTATLFVLGKYLIGLYLGTTALGSQYGAASSLVLMLVWAYYSSAIVLFGAELTEAHVRLLGERIQPEEHAERDHPEHTPRATETGRPVQRPHRGAAS